MPDATLRALIYGKAAHVDPIACIEDLPLELAARTMTGYPHSIWQIVDHMNYWMDYDLGKIAGDNRPYPERAIESWPAHPNPAADAHAANDSATDDSAANDQWQATTRRFVDLLAQLARLAESDASELTREVKYLGPGQSSKVSTVHAMLWQIVAHNSYHCGQVALLRRQLGAWPPRRGGDSW